MLRLIVCTVLLAAFWSSPALAASSDTASATDVSTGINGASSNQQPVTADIVPDPAQIDDTVQPLSDAGGSETESVAPAGVSEAAAAEPSEGTSDTSTATVEAEPAAKASGSENVGGDSATCCDTDEYLELICGQGAENVYWDSIDDYNAGLLSIKYKLTNTSATDLYQVRVTDATATKGVKIDTALPLSLGDLSPGEMLYFTLKWLIPHGVKGFQTDISICTDFEPLCEGPECDPKPICEGPECDPKPICEGPECDPKPICEGPECDPAPVCEGSGCTPAVIESGISDPVAFHASVLPNTGFSLATALIFCFGLILPLSLLLTVASRLVVARRS
jgi:hypothetical protein